MDISQQTLYAFSSFYHSAFFVTVKFIIGIYVVVLLADITLIVILRGFGADFRTILKGASVPAISKSAMEKKWMKIKDRLETGNNSYYKAAVLEADAIVDKIIMNMGFPGKSLTERLEKIRPAQIPNYDKIKEAHLVRNKIIHERDFSLDKKQTQELLEIYEKFLRSFELL